MAEEFWSQMYFNRRLLIEAGLPLQPAEDWDEFRTYAQKLTEYDANGAIAQAGYNFRMAGQFRAVVDGVSMASHRD